MPPVEKLRAVIYARQSQDRAGDEAAVDRQVTDCTALAAARGWDVADVLVDNSISASTGRERPGYERVLNLMRACAVDRVIVWHIDRLTRRVLDLEHVVELAEKADVRIATVTGDLDLSTDTGRLLARILAAVARAEVERKGARQRRANAQRRDAGVMLWTRRPFGYDRVGDQPFIIEAEAAHLRSAAAAVLDGASVGSQVRALNAAGAWTTAGNPWRTNVLQRALRNPRYAGRVTYLGDETGTSGRWPAVFDDATHEQLVALLSDPVRRVAPSTTLRHWLSGALECGRCGGPMYSGRTGRWLVYRCRSPHLTRSMPLLDQVLGALLVRRLTDHNLAEALTGDDVAAKAREQVVRLRERRDSLTVMLGEGLVSPAEARRQLEQIAADLAAASSRLAALTGQSMVTTIREADDPDAAVAGLTVAQRRQLWEDVVERCVILPVGKGATELVCARAVEVTWRM